MLRDGKGWRKEDGEGGKGEGEKEKEKGEEGEGRIGDMTI